MSQCGDVVRLRVEQPSGIQEVLALYKMSLGFLVLLYVPALQRDEQARRWDVVDWDPVCLKCGQARWYWHGDNPLFPERIACAICEPPQADYAARRSALSEIADQLCQKARGRPADARLLDASARAPWPVIQRALIPMWMTMSMPINVIRKQWPGFEEILKDMG